MPGPNSTPNGTKRNTEQYIPPKLARRIAEWEAAVAANKNGKVKLHKPGSQK